MAPTQDRVRRWIGGVASAAFACSLMGWRLGVHLLERTPAALPESVGPTCPGTLDPAHHAAAEPARGQFAAMLAERQIPGLTVAIAVGGQLVWSEGFGYADRERAVPACPHTQFRVHSVSKAVTAAGMARLAERGVFDLDAPVRTYIPDLPPDLGAVTARQLASHRAGVQNYRDDNEALNANRYETALASLEKFRDDPLLFPPDSGSAYSSYGFVLLSAAMEGASGVDFPRLMGYLVFEPLGMDRTEAERSGSVGVDRATFYDNVTPYSPDRRVQPSPMLDFSSKWASGGILSTAEDLVRFASAHIRPFNRGFLRDETLDELFTPRTTRWMVFGQGLGWMIARDHRARRVHLHFGAGSGGTSLLAVYPDQQAAIAVLANLGHARFPMRRLLAVAHPFVGDRLETLVWILAVFSLGVSLVLLPRRRA